MCKIVGIRLLRSHETSAQLNLCETFCTNVLNSSMKLLLQQAVVHRLTKVHHVSFHLYISLLAWLGFMEWINRLDSPPPHVSVNWQSAVIKTWQLHTSALLNHDYLRQQCFAIFRQYDCSTEGYVNVIPVLCNYVGVLVASVSEKVVGQNWYASAL